MLTFDPALHEYRYEGRVVPSVTGILAPLVDLSRIPPGVLERKRRIGTAVHAAIELHIKGELDPESVVEPWAPYFRAYERFLAESGAFVLESERKVFSKKYDYAGTLDAKLVLKKRLGVCDWKTCFALPASVGPQTAGYTLAVEEEDGEKIKDRWALQLRPDGTYRLEPLKDPQDFTTFLSCLQISKWLEAHK